MQSSSGRPIVVDTTALVAEVMATAKYGGPSRLQTLLESGTAIAHAGHHVWAEVPRVLEGNAAKGRTDGAEAERIWWLDIGKHIRFVDTDTLVADDAAARTLHARDLSDIPTAKLATLIGPVPVLAKDRDLTDVGLAYAEWRTTIRAGRATWLVDQQVQGSAALVCLGGAVAASAGSSIRRLCTQPGVAGAVAVTALAAGLAAGGVWLADPESSGRGILRAVGRGLTAVAVDVATRQVDARRLWDSTMVGTAGSSLEAATARTLARSAEPMTRADVARHLRPSASTGEHRMLVRRLGPILEERPAYVAVGRGWTLGRAGVAFR